MSDTDKPKTAADVPRKTALDAPEMAKGVIDGPPSAQAMLAALHRIAALPQPEPCDHSREAGKALEGGPISDALTALERIRDTPCAPLADAERARLAVYDALRARYDGLHEGKGSIPADHHALARELNAIDPATAPEQGDILMRAMNQSVDHPARQTTEPAQCIAVRGDKRCTLETGHQGYHAAPGVMPWFPTRETTEPAPRMVPLEEVIEFMLDDDTNEDLAAARTADEVRAAMAARFGQPEGE